MKLLSLYPTSEILNELRKPFVKSFAKRTLIDLPSMFSFNVLTGAIQIYYAEN